MDQTLFDKLGGQANVNAVVNNFYSKVLADATVVHFFKNTDMAHQAHQQATFLTMAFGGPNNYVGKDMKAAHANLAIKAEHFDTIVRHLAEALKEAGVSAAIIQEVAAVAETTRADIVNA